MLTMVLLLHSSSDAHALECATNRFMHAIRAADPVPTAIPPPVAGKAQREAHGVCAGSIETENFVLKWGGDDVPDAGSLEGSRPPSRCRGGIISAKWAIRCPTGQRRICSTSTSVTRATALPVRSVPVATTRSIQMAGQ